MSGWEELRREIEALHIYGEHKDWDFIKRREVLAAIDRAALSGSSTAPLDVERLARALNESVGTLGWLRLTPPSPVEEWRENARIIAAEYARLAVASPDPAQPDRAAGEGGDVE
jgi:hypothetical protein